MRRPDAASGLRAAVAAQGLVAGTAKRKPGRPGVTLVWLRPEPVTLRLDGKGVLWLEAYLPFVMPRGRLHKRVKAFLAEREALCSGRDGQVSVGLPGGAEALPRLLALAQGLRDMLREEWPDYATGLFAEALGE